MSKVYIVDDDVQISRLLSEAIEGFGLAVEIFNSGQEFIGVDIQETDVILLDLNMPDIDGIEVIKVLSSKQCGARLVLISGHDTGILHSAEQLAQAHALKIVSSMTKPIRLKHLRDVITGIIEQGVEIPEVSKVSHLQPDVEELREAIASSQFVLHYQPQINVQTSQLFGVEALVRWKHESRGLVYPDMFIPLAEEHNLIGELTELVISESLKQCRLWRDQNLNVPVSINISADNVKGQVLVEHLISVLKQFQLEPDCLTLEVTESALMGELIASLENLTRLRMKGFKLSIDDFGTGYSSLSQLHKIPFTELKIDKSFVMSMSNDVEARAIAKTCIMLGHELNMKVVAEGVESADILQTLKELGCDIAQGYHISRPIPANELLDWIKSQ